MLHTRTHKSRMATMAKQLIPEYTSCATYVHSGAMQQLSILDSECGTGVNRVNGQENICHLARRISAAWPGEYLPLGQENICRLARRISAAWPGEYLPLGQENICRLARRNVEQNK